MGIPLRAPLPQRFERIGEQSVLVWCDVPSCDERAVWVHITEWWFRNRMDSQTLTTLCDEHARAAALKTNTPLPGILEEKV